MYKGRNITPHNISMYQHVRLLLGTRQRETNTIRAPEFCNILHIHAFNKHDIFRQL